jgi:hypothetical protein
MDRCVRQSDVVERFQAAWERGDRPRIVDFLRPDQTDRRTLLVQLICSDLEHCLSAGEAACVERYVSQFPELATDAAAILDLVSAEVVLRRAHGIDVNPQTIVSRFPQCPELAERLAGDAGPAVGAHRGLSSKQPAHAHSETNFEFAMRQLPARLGRYRIIKLLGQGGMGTVYQAVDQRLDRQVALKVMRSGAENSELVERFYREAQIAASFTHPNLCPVYDFAQSSGVFYLTMPLLTGRPLSALLASRGALPPTEAAHLTATIARALSAAHHAGIIHRDLKPANIMMNEREEPVVMDFGLARRIGPLDPRLTAPGALLGTPAYMPPEQIGGRAADRPSQDIYSLGVIFYEMLTGRAPFVGSTDEVLAQALTKNPVSPSRVRRGVSPVLDRACMTAIAKNPGERFPSMEAFAQALEPVQPMGALPATCAGQGSRRSRLVVAASLGVVAVTLVVILILIGWLSWDRFGSTTTDRGGSSQPDAPAAAKDNHPADLFQAGSEWQGTFRWSGDDYDRPVRLMVQERDGDRFKGTYDGDDGQYVWRIEGTVREARVEWRFTDIVHEREPKAVVGVATISGTLVTAGRFEGRFTGRESHASLILQLKQ